MLFLSKYYLKLGATPISSMSGGDGVGEVSSVSPVGNVDNVGNVGNVGGFGNLDTSPKGIAGLAASAVLGGPAGLALNIGAQLVGVPSLSEIGKATMNALGFSRTDSDFATAGVFGGDDSSSTGTANATDTGDMGSEAANNAATDAANASAGVGDGGGPGGGDSGATGGPFRDGGRVGLYDGGSAFDNYRALNLGGRIGYAEGGTGPSPDAAETYSEYKARMLEALRKSHGGQKTAYTDVQPDGSSSGISRDLPIEDYFNYMLADAYALGFNPNTGLKFGVDDRGVLTDQYKFKQEMADFKKNSQTTPTMGEPGGIITDGGLRYRINADGSRTLLDTATEQTTPTEDFSDYLNTTTINTNAQDYGVQNSSGAEYLGLGDKSITDPKAALALTLGRASYAVDPQTGKVNLTGGTDYNFEENQLPFGLGTFINKGGIKGFLGLGAKEATQYAPNISVNPNYIKQTYQAERPLESAFERFTGAAGPLAENINTAISSLNPFQKQQYMNYAVQNPDQAIAAAQRNKDFLAATQKNTNPATSAPASMADGGRVFYLQGGLASLLG
jgi:hypothetical protein